MKLNKKTQQFLKLFDENKLLILKALYNCKNNVCGCDLAKKLDIPKNLVSYHIRILRELSVIEEAKCGKNKIYQIKTEFSNKIEEILKVLELD